MPSLRVVLSGQGPKVYHLYKKITSIGRGEENDIALPDPLLSDAHARIHFDGRDFNVTALVDTSGTVVQRFGLGVWRTISIRWGSTMKAAMP